MQTGAGSPGVMLGSTMYGVAAWIWLLAFARIDVSRAYPFVGLGFVLTMAFSVTLLGEFFSMMRVIGMPLDSVDVAMVAQS